MKEASDELKTLLHSGEEFIIVDLYTLALADGTIVGRYTSADFDLVVGGNTYLSKASQIVRGTVTNSIGLDVDSLDVTIYATINDTILDLPSIHAFRSGIMDNSIFTCHILFMPKWEDTLIPPLLHFEGRMSIREISAIQVDLEVRSESEMLNIDLPRHIIEPSCVHQLYEAGCDLNKSTFEITGTMDTDSTSSVIKCSLDQDAGWFDLGIIIITSGQNTSICRTVRSYTPGVINLVYPLPYDPSEGDTFTVYPGCDMTTNACLNKFNNLSHFRGCPFLPTTETIY